MKNQLHSNILLPIALGKYNSSTFTQEPILSDNPNLTDPY